VKRLRRYLRILAIALGAGAIVLAVAGIILFRYTWSGLQRRITAIQAAGDPVRLSDLARPPIPDDQNAATFLSGAQAGVNAINRKLAPLYDHKSYQHGRLTDADRKDVRAAFATHSEVVPLLEQAAACPDFNDQRDYGADPKAVIGSLLPELQDFRVVANVLKARARLLAVEGDVPGAVSACVTLLRLIRLYEREPPLLIDYLMTAACRGVAINSANAALRLGPVPQSTRDELERELALDDALKSYLLALKVERANIIENFEKFVPRYWVNPVLSTDQCGLIDLYTQQLAVAERPYADAITSLQAPRSRSIFSMQPFTGLQTPAVHKTRQTMDRIRAQARCLRVLNALQRAKGSGTAEPKPSELGLPAEAITDPYTGEPLHIKKIGDSWLIYAVGENLIDDGGDLEKMKDVGLGPLP
jgi:hypothetical protein